MGKNQVLKSLMEKSVATNLNATSTLPLDIKSKNEIYKEVADNGKTGMSLKLSQTYAYAKMLMKFYKSGVSNVWNNNKQYKLLKNQQFKINSVVGGKDTDIKLPNFVKLTHHMSQMLFINKIENERGNSGIKDHSKGDFQITPKLFNLSRGEYQLIKRTPKDFMKLPMFAIIFAIFVEMTPIICYAIPQVTPSTCVLPSIEPRIWNSAYNREIQKSVDEENLFSQSTKTAYNLPLNQVQNLCKALNLVSKYIPSKLYPESVLRDRLQNHFNYLSVDNYYLSGLNGNGNINNLSFQELLNACLERNLIIDLKEEMSKFDKIDNEVDKQKIQNELMIDLKGKLTRFIIDFQNSNIGYLTITNNLPPVDSSKLQQYRN
ncbi:hypothetical protein CLIB1444_02S05248 [[Candida] jaroonii]|uniref:Uncharacterized protein n=1 Tax=[Candida] jaroonii TaxID=467808 RepID=A0ACA9Y4I6_9ASCO|nr:hypothetical protein CLIB1444_02S05248 [[Candida] jaroonii]